MKIEHIEELDGKRFETNSLESESNDHTQIWPASLAIVPGNHEVEEEEEWSDMEDKIRYKYQVILQINAADISLSHAKEHLRTTYTLTNKKDQKT